MQDVKIEPVGHARLLRLALPMTVAHLSTPLLGFADATVIGRLGQASLLGAIAAAAVIFDVLFWGFGFLRMGTAGLTAQAAGAADPAEERAILARALVLAAAIGVALIALQMPIAAVAFALLGAGPQVTAAAHAYFDMRIWSAPFALANYAVLGALTGRGRTDLALALQILINLGNIGLNVALVYGFGLGVRGSALGTLIAEVIGAGAGLMLVARVYANPLGVPMRVLFARKAFARMMALNGDIMVRTLLLLFSFAFFTSQGARNGDATLAANAVLMNLFLSAAYFLDGFATAAEQMCGQALGAGDGASFRAAVRLALQWSLAFGAGAAVLAFIGGRAFIDFVSTNPEVRRLAHGDLVFAALTPLLGAAAFAFDGIFVGATWSRDMRNMMILSTGAFIAAFVALRGLGNAGLWASLLIFLAARGGALGWRYRSRVSVAFPALQSAAACPTPSASER
jgi:MATE family multidrug resistance protein